jgi:translocation and assembly module TamA
VIGGKHLMVGSIEIDHLLTDKWGVAAFVDSGNAFDRTPVNPKTGIGLGIRWRSPVGPIRIDFAYALNKDNSPFRIHFSMGPDL